MNNNFEWVPGYSNRQANLKRFRGVFLCILMLANVCLFFTGCAIQSTGTLKTHTATVFANTDQLKSRKSIRRIVIPRFENQTNNPQIADALQVQLAEQLRSKSGFEILSLPDYSAPPCPARSITNGRFLESSLVELYHRYNADAVLVASVNEFSSFNPMTLGITIHVVDVRTAEVVASIDGLWNSENAIDRIAFSEFIENQKTESYRTPLYQKSPRVFSQFVIDEIGSMLSQSPNDSTRKLTETRSELQPVFKLPKRSNFKPFFHRLQNR